MAFALSLFMFSGNLAFAVPVGLSVLILSTIVISVTSYLFGQSRSSVSLAQDSSLAILAPAVVAAGMSAKGGMDGQLATALAVIGLTTILSGLLMVLVSLPRIGRILKLVPFSVSVGFLASSGWLLAFAAISSVTHAESLGAIVQALRNPDMLYLVVPTVILGFALVFASSTGSGVLPILVVFGISIAGFYAFLWIMGIDIETARARNFLFNHDIDLPDPTEFLGLYTAIDFGAIWSVSFSILAASLVSVLACLLNITGLELVSRKELDLNHGMRTTGLSNVLIGGFGGAPSFSTIGSSSLVVKFNVGTGLFHAVYILVAVLGLAFASTIVSFAPTFASAGFLMYIGLSLIIEWVVETRKRLPTSEWLVAFAIFLMTIFFGIQVALVFGLALALVLFITAYASLPIIRLSSDGGVLKSNVDRQDAEMKLLDDAGDSIKVVALQGYLFFGSIDRLIDTFSKEGDTAFRFFILDFGSVTGIDASASSNLAKLGFIAEQRGVGLVYCNVTTAQNETLALWDIAPGQGAVQHFSNTLDEALEWCENALLHGAELAQDSADPTEIFFEFFERPEDWISRLEVPAGTTLIKAGDTDQDLYFLAKGNLSVWITSPSGSRVRVRSMNEGTYVGEIAMFTQQARTADIITDAPSTLFVVKQADLQRLQTEKPAAALRLYQHMARHLAHSLQRSNRVVRQLSG